MEHLKFFFSYFFLNFCNGPAWPLGYICFYGTTDALGFGMWATPRIQRKYLKENFIDKTF